MEYLSTKLEKFFPLLKNSIIPAILFGIATILFYTKANFETNTQVSAHYFFYILATISGLILLYFNQSKPIFLIISVVLSYAAINYLKTSLGKDFISSAAYMNICFFAPINILFLYFLPNQPLLKRKNAYILLALLVELSLIENLTSRNISIGVEIEGINALSAMLFIIMNITFFITSSVDGRIGSTALFFAGLCISLGFYFAEQSTALSIFFFTAMLIITLAIGESIYYSTYKDVLTGLYSRQSFIINSKNFPMKYCIGIIAIDEYANISKAFGKLSIEAITKMIADKISELETDNNIYRYNDDEFVIVFRNETRDISFEKMENIRRAIAASEFVLSKRKKPIKLTISGSLTEKKRSDANSVEVLKRAHKALQKTYKFTQNVTTKA